ncbi:MAG: S9 family peptidase [Desulfobacterales bacterium]|nr:MAG: S9 family peptidase [Desulfobacterales bacterium]
MSAIKSAPFGSWQSPLTSDLIVSETVGLSESVLDGQDVYWLEMRPSEGGRYVIVRRTPNGQTRDITPAHFSARTRVHEYGGGSFLVYHGRVYFVNFSDQRLYLQEPGAQPRPLTPESDLRFADGIMDSRRRRLIWVCEDHTPGDNAPSNFLALITLNGSDSAEIKRLVSGCDFYSSPCISPDGAHVAWLSWNHPHMPWDGTELWVGEFSPDGALSRSTKVAGGNDESLFQPQWSPEGSLYFISDRSNWWNLYRWRDGRVEPLVPMEAEFGVPQWVFGLSTYGFESPKGIICTYTRNGAWQLARLDSDTGELEEIQTPYTEIAYLRAAPGRAVFIGGAPTEPKSVVQLKLASREWEVLRRSSRVRMDPGFRSLPQPIEFPTEQGQTAHAFFYPPNNQDYRAPAGERPPLLVFSHGGPTAATAATLNLAIQYWTSRGFAVLDVNYGGSSGFGRRYRQRLNGRWGIVDVQDCINGARYLVEHFDMDPNRLAIRGGSAGGYTALCALTFHDTFKAGASYYGVSDLESLARDTHKFEARYLDNLIGPFPEHRDLYRQRSPIHFGDRLSCPIIFFQGLEDKVVPPRQAEMMVNILIDKGLPVAYLAFEKEQHGFRQAENIKRALDAELYFYSRIFGFDLADPVAPVRIENL